MNRSNVQPTRRLALLLAAGLFAAIAPAAAGDCLDKAALRESVAGVHTGEIAPGGPVYRLPPVHVVADRRTELARIKQEEQLARERQARAKAATKPAV